MNKAIYVILCFLCACSSNPYGEVGQKTGDEPVNGYEAREYSKNKYSIKLPYRFYTPDVEKGKLYPLVVFMHGAGKAQGTDNSSQLIHGSQLFVKPEIQEKYPCYVVAPQCPKDVWWVNVLTPPGIPPEIDRQIKEETGKKAFRLKARKLMNDPDLYFPLDTKNITEPMQMTSELIDDIIKNYPIDPERVYITGGSMGGLGTWCLAFMNPDRPAAIAPFSCPSNPVKAALLKDMPIWMGHGDKDDYFPVKCARDMYKALKDAGNKRVIYTEAPGVGHGLSPRAYKWDEDGDGIEDVASWLFSQRKRK